MPHPPRRRFSLVRAFVCSGGLHLLAAVALGLLIARSIAAGHSGERVEVASEQARPSLLVLERREPQRAPVRQQAVRATKPEESKVGVGPAVERRPQLMAVAGERSAQTSSVAPASERADSRTTNPVAAATVPPAAAPLPASSATPEVAVVPPSPSPAAVKPDDVPAGGWGEFAKPLVADDSALDDIRGKYHAAASVQVDETGHAISVSFAGPVPSDARAEIERRLLALRYVPAECNGLRCSGSLKIDL
jgi:hypothetical protein